MTIGLQEVAQQWLRLATLGTLQSSLFLLGIWGLLHACRRGPASLLRLLALVGVAKLLVPPVLRFTAPPSLARTPFENAVVHGLWRHCVLLPAAWRTWTPECVRTVLLHEMAHVRRGDHWVQVAQTVALAVHWFNPLAWVLHRKLAHYTELACDDATIACGRLAPAVYARHLLRVAEDLARAPMLVPARFAVPDPGGSLSSTPRTKHVRARTRRSSRRNRAKATPSSASTCIVLARSPITPCVPAGALCTASASAGAVW